MHRLSSNASSEGRKRIDVESAFSTSPKGLTSGYAKDNITQHKSDYVRQKEISSLASIANWPVQDCMGTTTSRIKKARVESSMSTLQQQRKPKKRLTLKKPTLPLVVPTCESATHSHAASSTDAFNQESHYKNITEQAERPSNVMPLLQVLDAMPFPSMPPKADQASIIIQNLHDILSFEPSDDRVPEYQARMESINRLISHQ